MMKRFTVGLGLSLIVRCFGLVLLLPGIARADDIWRLAGTFNGWNTGDAAFALNPVTDKPGHYRIERRFPLGSHRFKFVKNGDWSRGHFGMGEPGTPKLAMPGDDLPLRVTVDAVYRIELDESGRTWSSGVASVDSPVVVAHVFGQPIVGRGFVLDLSQSLSPAGVERGWTVLATGEATKVQRIPGTPERYRIIPDKPGAFSVRVSMNAGAQTASEVLPFTAISEPPAQPGRNMLEYRPAADARVWTVGVTGDFNNWATPESNPGPLAMQSRDDGSFFLFVDFPDGAYRYQFVINSEQYVNDTSNQRVARRDAAAGGVPCSLLVVGREPGDFPAAQSSAINSDAIRHAPSQLSDFRPISRALGLADISVCALPGDVEQAFVYIDAAPGVIGSTAEQSAKSTSGGVKRLAIPMHRVHDLSGFDRWTARVMTGQPSGRARYSLGFKDGAAEFISKDYDAGLAPELELPAWALGAVWYQIFPERFRNGNPLNDPHGPGVTQMPWNSDWYGISDAEAEAWKKRAKIPAGAPLPAHTGGPLYNVVWDRRYGGDLQGVVDKLDYIKSLGINAIYLNPVFEAESMHKYDATDYRHIDDNFAQPKSAGRVPESWARIMAETEDPSTWTWTAADRYFVDTFLPEAKRRGIRVVIDGVFNHTGRPFWAFDDIERNGVNSPYKDFFFVEFDDSGKLKSWVSWFNTGALPKFRQTSNGDLVPPVKRHIFGITSRWMDPNGDGDPSDGIDGWRLDVALDVGLPFWRDWRKHVKSINPDAIIIAEIWDDASEFVKGDSFDTQMHYPFAKPVTDWLAVRPGTSSTQLIGRLLTAFDDAPQTNLIHQNLFCSHDTDRYVSMLFNPGREYDGRNRLQDPDGQEYRQGKPSPETYALSLLGVAIQATYLGSPMVYYGDEVGMYGADDPTDRKPFPWPDTGEPQNPSDRRDDDIHREYSRWLNLRRDPTVGPVLRYGSIRHLDSGRHDVFFYTRELNGVRVVVGVNRGSEPVDATALLPEGTPEPTIGGVAAKFWLIKDR